MSRPIVRAHTPLRQLPGTALLVLALLWAQLLGLAHGVLHAVPAAVTAPGVSVQVQATPAPGLLAHLLAPAGDEGECRLYDQMGHGAPALQLAFVLPSVLPLLPAWAVLLPRPLEPCAAFAARAPPRSR